MSHRLLSRRYLFMELWSCELWIMGAWGCSCGSWAYCGSWSHGALGADRQDGRMVGTVREESCGTRSGSDELCLATGMRVFLYHVILQLELDVDVDVLT